MFDKLKELFNYDNSKSNEPNRINVLIRALSLMHMFYNGILIAFMFNSFSYSPYKSSLFIFEIGYIIVLFITFKFPGRPAILSFCLNVIATTIFSIALFGTAGGFSYNMLLLTLILFYNTTERFNIKLFNSIFIGVLTSVVCSIINRKGSLLVLSYQDSAVLGPINTAMSTVCIIVIAIYYYKKFAVAEESILNYAKELEVSSITDMLTGLYNRRGLKLDFEKYDYPNTCAAIMDIDDFKHINDTYGHDVGDVVLKQLGTLLVKYAKQYNMSVCRWGGEECVIVYDQVTNQSDFETVLENIRFEIDTTPVEIFGKTIPYHVTIGAAWANEAKDYGSMIHLADERLYYGKQHGKNVIITTTIND